jgi:sugar/nucleoside kinase (ribokinase family)
VQAIDTIAAGDTFNGALVTALLEDRLARRFVLRMPRRRLPSPAKARSLPCRGAKKSTNF